MRPAARCRGTDAKGTGAKQLQLSGISRIEHAEIVVRPQVRSSERPPSRSPSPSPTRPPSTSGRSGSRSSARARPSPPLSGAAAASAAADSAPPPPPPGSAVPTTMAASRTPPPASRSKRRAKVASALSFAACSRAVPSAPRRDGPPPPAQSASRRATSRSGESRVRAVKGSDGEGRLAAATLSEGAEELGDEAMTMAAAAPTPRRSVASAATPRLLHVGGRRRLAPAYVACDTLRSIFILRDTTASAGQRTLRRDAARRRGGRGPGAAPRGARGARAASPRRTAASLGTNNELSTQHARVASNDARTRSWDIMVATRVVHVRLGTQHGRGRVAAPPGSNECAVGEYHELAVDPVAPSCIQKRRASRPPWRLLRSLAHDAARAAVRLLRRPEHLQERRAPPSPRPRA